MTNFGRQSTHFWVIEAILKELYAFKVEESGEFVCFAPSLQSELLNSTAMVSVAVLRKETSCTMTGTIVDNERNQRQGYDHETRDCENGAFLIIRLPLLHFGHVFILLLVSLICRYNGNNFDFFNVRT